jgi:ribosomal 50S subunit-associated protein YjgA (DUF615 family)
MVMNTPTTDSASDGPLEMVDTLIATLEDEYQALQALSASFQAQLNILHQKNLDGLEDATLQASEAVSQLNRLTQARTRQLRLVGRLLNAGDDPDVGAITDAVDALDGGDARADRLRTLRQQMRAEADATQQQSAALRYALQYAADLGREMIAFLRGATASAPAQVYTDSGQSPDTDRDSLVNQIG